MPPAARSWTQTAQTLNTAATAGRRQRQRPIKRCSNSTPVPPRSQSNTAVVRPSPSSPRYLRPRKQCRVFNFSTHNTTVTTITTTSFKTINNRNVNSDIGVSSLSSSLPKRNYSSLSSRTVGNTAIDNATMPTQSKAIVMRDGKLVDETVTLPALAEREILIRVESAALNPTDNLAYGLNAFGDGAVLGCDFAGTIKEVGSAASRFKVGDKVATFIWGGERQFVGALSEYCIADERFAFKVPDGITLDQAATVPLAAMTAFLALFSKDCLQLEQSNPTKPPVMILGGSSTVGAFATQIARSHGIDIIATSSQKNAQAVTDNGAKAVFDYHDSNVIQHVQKDFPDVDTVFDTIGSPASTASAGELLGSRQSKLVTVRPGKTHCENLRDNVQVSDVFVFTIFPKEHSYRGKAVWPINPGNVELGEQFFGQLHDLLAEGKIIPRPVKSLGSLNIDGLKQGLDMLKNGEVSNAKLCFTVA